MDPSLKERLRKTVEDAKRSVGTYLGRSLGEQNTKASLIDPVLRALGWNVHDPEEVDREYRKKPKDKPVDYALKSLRELRLFIEAKGLGENLSDRRWISQVLSYATVAGVEWCVLTDGNEYRLYNVTAPVDAEEKLFRRIRISDDDLTYVVENLGLLSRSNLDGNLLEMAWKAYYVDRRVERVLKGMLQSLDKSLVGLLRRRIPNLKPKDIAESLGRLKVQITLPLTIPPEEVPPGPKKPITPARQRKGSATGFPTQRNLQVPLLKAILRRGGSIRVRTELDEIAAELANALGLAQEQHTMQRLTGGNAWRNHLQWVRNDLCELGEIAREPRGLWTVTEKGKQRAQGGS